MNKNVRQRIASRLSSPRKGVVHIDGVLDMADFKPNDLKCRIDPATGTPVLCTFQERDAARVKALLCEPVRVTGLGVFQTHTQKLKSVLIETIERLPSLSASEGDFYSVASLEDLAANQKVKSTGTFADLAGGFPGDEDIDRFLEEIYEDRK